MSSRKNRREELRERQRLAAEAAGRRRRIRRWVGWGTSLIAVALVVVMLLTSRTTSTSSARPAPDFTLTTTSDTRVSLSSLRGRPVLLYFSEGAGCEACLMQMQAIEKQQAAFDALKVTVLPIVMNTRAEILPDMQRSGVTTPFLLDNGTVSQEYGVLGKGMHANLPGHGFVLIDAAGTERWYGEYPSMWLDPSSLLDLVKSHLTGSPAA